jgi:NIPSNAP
MSKKVFSSLFISLLVIASCFGQAKTKQLYELRIYEARFGTSQVNLDNYLKNALIPALNKQGVLNVGVMKEMGHSEPAKLYVLIPYPSIESYSSINTKIQADEEFKKASLEYNSLSPDKSPYTRINTSLLVAFEGIPTLIAPKQEPRIFEIRTYEGYNEDAVRRKVKMFNEGELDIFKKTKLNSVFFGEMIAGDLMPCLTYMLTFKNMEERDANWKVFGSSPEWKTISSLPEYSNTVSRITKVFLEPTAYSQL